MLYYIRSKYPDVAYEIRPDDSRKGDAELVNSTPRVVHIANFKTAPMVVDDVYTNGVCVGRIVRVE